MIRMLSFKMNVLYSVSRIAGLRIPLILLLVYGGLGGRYFPGWMICLILYTKAFSTRLSRECWLFDTCMELSGFWYFLKSNICISCEIMVFYTKSLSYFGYRSSHFLITYGCLLIAQLRPSFWSRGVWRSGFNCSK